MDLNKLMARAKAILLSPKSEWPVITGESTSVADLYKGYVIPLAALAAIFGFLQMSVIGTPTLFGGTVRMGIGFGLTNAVLTFVMGLVMVYLLGLIVDALAPSFGGQKNNIQAVKLVAYSATAGCVASIGGIVPGLGILIGIAGAIYSIYLLYLGLPQTMKCPPEKAAGYTVVVVIIAIVVGAVAGAVIGTVVGGASMMRAATYSPSNGGDDVKFDENSPLGKMQKWGQDMEAANRKLEAAQKSGDQGAQEAAMKAVLGAALSGGQQVEALAPDRLKSFVPEELAGLNRSSISAERNGALGLQVSTAKATYSNDSGRQVRLEITDAGNAKGLLGLASWVGLEGEKEENGRREKTFREDDRLMHEEWDSNASRGQYTVVVGDRFTVKVEGAAGSVAELREAAEQLNLAGLADLRAEGVKN